MDTINQKCGEYDKNCDNTKMVKLMGNISKELDNENVHPGVNNMLKGITINSALKAVHGED